MTLGLRKLRKKTIKRKEANEVERDIGIIEGLLIMNICENEIKIIQWAEAAAEEKLAMFIGKALHVPTGMYRGRMAEVYRAKLKGTVPSVQVHLYDVKRLDGSIRRTLYDDHWYPVSSIVEFRGTPSPHDIREAFEKSQSSFLGAQ